MAKRKVETVKGSDIEVGKVYKFGGRWMRVISIDPEDTLESGNFFARVIAHDKDPRYDQIPHLRKSIRLKYVFADEDMPTRDEPARVSDWVTREIERQNQEA